MSGVSGMGDGFDRTPFEARLAAQLAASVEGLRAPASLAARVREGVVTPAAPVVSGGLRGRIAAAFTSVIAFVAGKRGPLLVGSVAVVAAAAVVTLVVVDNRGDDASNGPGDDAVVIVDDTASVDTAGEPPVSRPPDATPGPDESSASPILAGDESPTSTSPADARDDDGDAAPSEGTTTDDASSATSAPGAPDVSTTEPPAAATEPVRPATTEPARPTTTAPAVTTTEPPVTTTTTPASTTTSSTPTTTSSTTTSTTTTTTTSSSTTTSTTTTTTTTTTPATTTTTTPPTTTTTPRVAPTNLGVNAECTLTGILRLNCVGSVQFDDVGADAYVVVLADGTEVGRRSACQGSGCSVGFTFANILDPCISVVAVFGDEQRTSEPYCGPWSLRNDGPL